MTRFSSRTQNLAQRRFNTVKKLVHALVQPVVLKHQGVTHHDAAHAGVFFAKLQKHGHHMRSFLSTIAFFVSNLVDQGKNRLLNEVDQAFKHLGFAGKVAVQRRLAHA